MKEAAPPTGTEAATGRKTASVSYRSRTSLGRRAISLGTTFLGSGLDLRVADLGELYARGVRPAPSALLLGSFMCNHRPQCTAPKLVVSYGKDKGKRITDHAEFLDKAAEVLGLFLEMPTVPPSHVTLKSYLPLLQPLVLDYELERDFKARLKPETEARSATALDSYGLCGEHARQLARGALSALHYMGCFPDSLPPPPRLIWGAGRITHFEDDEVLPAVVALYRAHALGLADSERVRGAFAGVHERGRRVVLRAVDEAEEREILGLIGLMALGINGERNGVNGPEPYGLTERYREDDHRLLSTIVEYYRQWADLARLPKEGHTRAATQVTMPPGQWFRVGF